MCNVGLCLLLLLLASCSSFGVRTRNAASSAAADPWTWIPLTGAALVTATDSDARISRWATSETPVFGSREAALDASDRFRRYASDSAWALLLTTPPRDEAEWLAETGTTTSGNLLGLAAARNTTGLLKHSVQRERPNHQPVHDSFPSAHSTDAFSHASLARSIADQPTSYRPLRQGVEWASNGFAFATAWGRVEGGAHYPTDVLIGAALANFTTRFVSQLAAHPKFDWQMRTRTNEKGIFILEFEKAL